MTIALAFFITLSLWLYTRLCKFNNLIRFQREYIEIIEQDLQDMEEEKMSKQDRLIIQIENNLKTIKDQNAVIEVLKNQYVDKERIK